MPGESYCYVHHPDTKEERRRHGSKGGRRGGRGRSSLISAELARLQALFERLADDVLEGKQDRSAAVVAIQALNGARGCVIGAPGLFAYAYRGTLVRTWQEPKLTRSEKLTHEEAREYKEGCPSCGRNVPTYPIVMRSPLADTRIPDPYPLRDWPDPPERLIWKAGNVYSDAERREA